MKTLICLLIGTAALLVTAGCEEGHEHHEHHYGGAYDGTYHNSGHYEQYPANQGYWDRDGDWHPR